MKKLINKLYGIAADKLLHFIVGAIIAQLVIGTLDLCVADKYVVFGAGLASALAAGFLKELKDGEHADAYDYIATLIGGGVGTLLAFLVWI